MDVVPILRGAVSDAACRTYKTLWSACRAFERSCLNPLHLQSVLPPHFSPHGAQGAQRHPLLLLAATTSAAILISIDFDLDQSEIIDLSLLI
jgi:hypothetical protein